MQSLGAISKYIVDLAQNENFGCAKATGLKNRKQANIINMDLIRLFNRESFRVAQILTLS